MPLKLIIEVSADDVPGMLTTVSSAFAAVTNHILRDKGGDTFSMNEEFPKGKYFIECQGSKAEILNDLFKMSRSFLDGKGGGK